jgi:hypothetical protein
MHNYFVFLCAYVFPADAKSQNIGIIDFKQLNFGFQARTWKNASTILNYSSVLH